MRFKAFLFVFAMFLPFSLSAAENYVEGVHYARIDPPQPVDSAPGKVQIAELFWYGCPHCAEFEPQVAAWVKRKPAFVDFVRIPAAFKANVWLVHAKAFYAAEALGLGNKFHDKFFHALQVEHNPLANEEQLAEFFKKNGVKEAAFRDAFNSFAVATKANRAMELSRRYQVSGVPTVIVAGKYRIDRDMAGSYENVLRVAEYLARKEKR